MTSNIDLAAAAAAALKATLLPPVDCTLFLATIGWANKPRAEQPSTGELPRVLAPVQTGPN